MLYGSSCYIISLGYMIYHMIIGKETAVSLITKFKTNNEEIILKCKFHCISAAFRNSLVSFSGNLIDHHLAPYASIACHALLLL